MPRYKMVNGEKVQLTAEEEAARDAEEAAWTAGAKDRSMANLRAKRNNLLKETDHYGLSDVTMSDEVKTYRQALRDLPTHKNWPDLKEEDFSNPMNMFSMLMGGGGDKSNGLMDIVKNVGTKLHNRLESGSLDQNALFGETNEMRIRFWDRM